MTSLNNSLVFTFHYVSINTIVRAVIAYAAVALYIPLCFY